MKVIDELQLFETELEAVAEFGGFTDLFHSFEFIWLDDCNNKFHTCRLYVFSFTFPLA